MPFWTEILPPKQPTGDSHSRNRRATQLLVDSTGWWPAIAAFILALSGLAVVANQQSAVGPAPVIREAALPTTDRDGLIDLNTATRAELETLPGIGAARAESIVQLRGQERFRSLADLADRRILSPAQLAALADFATVYAPAR